MPLRRTRVLHRGLLLVAVLACRCATAISGTRESIAVDSTPIGADATLICAGTRVDSGVTPTTLTIRRNAGDCILKVSKSGFAEKTTFIDQGMNPVYWANFIATPLLQAGALVVSWGDNAQEKALGAGFFVTGAAGWVIDYWSGAMYRHRPEAVHVTLQPKV